MFKYTYDATNRLVKAEKAFKDPSYTPSGGSAGDLETGSTLVTYAYDGLDRRITRFAEHSGALTSATYKMVYLYDGNRVVNEAWESALDEPLKQHVWGLSYIDELVETRLITNYSDSGAESYDAYYALHDTRYCVLGLVDSSGQMVERYEYTPDGRRQLYLKAGPNDPGALTPSYESPRQGTTVNGTGFTLYDWSLCTIGFQGLMHDEVTGNVYQRAREYSPGLGRFMQRDPLGYPDGMNTYAAYHVMLETFDPSGMHPGIWLKERFNQGIDAFQTGKSALGIGARKFGNNLRGIIVNDNAAQLIQDIKETKQLWDETVGNPIGMTRC